MGGLAVVARELDDATDVYCLYCGTQLVDVAMSDFPSVCGHVLYRADSEVGFTFLGAWAVEHLTAKGFGVDGGALDWLVEHPDPDSEAGEEFEDDPYVSLSSYLEVADGLLLIDTYPSLAGGGATYLALAGPEVITR